MLTICALIQRNVQDPKDLEAVDDYLNVLATKCSVMINNNPNILVEFEKRKKEIASISRELEDVVSSNSELAENLTRTREVIFSSLRSLSALSHLNVTDLAGSTSPDRIQAERVIFRTYARHGKSGSSKISRK